MGKDSNQSGMERWESGLCNVMAEPGGFPLCCKACLCPCVVFGENMERVGSDQMFQGNKLDAITAFGSLCCLQSLFCCTLPFVSMVAFPGRQSIRKKFGPQRGSFCTVSFVSKLASRYLQGTWRREKVRIRSVFSAVSQDFCVSWCCFICQNIQVPPVNPLSD